MRIRSIAALTLALLCIASGCSLQARQAEPSPSTSSTTSLGPKMKIEDRSNKKARERSFSLPENGNNIKIDGGTDIAAGRYAIYVSGNLEKSLEVLDTRAGIHEARPFYSQNFEIPKDAASNPKVPAYTMDISQDERLTVGAKGNVNLTFKPQKTVKSKVLPGPGEWIAGVDFPAGNYRVEATGSFLTRIYKADGSRTLRRVLGRKGDRPLDKSFDEGDVVAYNLMDTDSGSSSSSPSSSSSSSPSASPSSSSASPSSPSASSSSPSSSRKMTLRNTSAPKAGLSGPDKPWKDNAPEKASGAPVDLNARENYQVGRQIPPGYYKLQAVAPEQLSSLTLTMHKDQSQPLGRLLIENSDHRSPIPTADLADVHLVNGQTVKVDARAVKSSASYYSQGRGEAIIRLVPANRPTVDTGHLTRSLLLVGRDIPAGTYTVTAVEQGYYDVMVSSPSAINYWFTSIGRSRNENSGSIELHDGDFVSTDTNSYVQLEK